jgi:hypothetical protein
MQTKGLQSGAHFVGQYTLLRSALISIDCVASRVSGATCSSCGLRSNESRPVRGGEVTPPAPTPVSSALHETAVNGWLIPGPLSQALASCPSGRASQITQTVYRGLFVGLFSHGRDEKFLSGSAMGQGSGRPNDPTELLNVRITTGQIMPCMNGCMGVLVYV